MFYLITLQADGAGRITLSPCVCTCILRILTHVYLYVSMYTSIPTHAYLYVFVCASNLIHVPMYVYTSTRIYVFSPMCLAG